MLLNTQALHFTRRVCRKGTASFAALRVEGLSDLVPRQLADEVVGAEGLAHAVREVHTLRDAPVVRGGRGETTGMRGGATQWQGKAGQFEGHGVMPACRSMPCVTLLWWVKERCTTGVRGRGGGARAGQFEGHTRIWLHAGSCPAWRCCVAVQQGHGWGMMLLVVIQSVRQSILLQPH